MFLWTAIPKSKKIGWGPVARPTKTKPQTHQLRNEAQRNCVALRSSLDYEVAWRPVKGHDERQKPAPLTALHATERSVVDVGEKNMEGRHVGLDFYDLLIDVMAILRRLIAERLRTVRDCSVYRCQQGKQRLCLGGARYIQKSGQTLVIPTTAPQPTSTAMPLASSGKRRRNGCNSRRCTQL